MLSIIVTKPLSAEGVPPFQASRLREEARVIVRLYGRIEDVEAVVSHWRIEVEWPHVNRNPHDYCAVDAMLSFYGAE